MWQKCGQWDKRMKSNEIHNDMMTTMDDSCIGDGLDKGDNINIIDIFTYY